MCNTCQQCINHKSILKFGTTFIASFFLISGLQIENNQLKIDKAFLPLQAEARNLPTSNGALGLNRGTAATLVPILEIRNSVDSAILQLPNVLNCKDLLSNVPNIEKDFKKLFDEHSEGISYKQQFLDQNAFLVYVYLCKDVYLYFYEGFNKSVYVEGYMHKYTFLKMF